MADPDPYAVGLAVLDRLKQHNDERRVKSVALREKIRQIIGADPDLTAREVQEKIIPIAPALRTVQWHLQNIRATRRSCAVE